MKISLIVTALVGAIALSGCVSVLMSPVSGALAKARASNEKLLDKTETATGVFKDNLTIDENSIKYEDDALKYIAHDKNGNIYKCNYSSIVGNESDALCTKLSPDGNSGGDSGKQSSNCNALLKAAGKCD